MPPRFLSGMFPARTLRLQYGAIIDEIERLRTIIESHIEGSTTNSDLEQPTYEETYEDAATHTLGEVIAIPVNSHVLIDVQATSVAPGAAGSRTFSETREFLNTNGVITEGEQETLRGPKDLATAPATTLTIARVEGQANVHIQVGGAAARWRIDHQRVRVTYTAE